MDAIGKVNGSVWSAVQETAISLAHVNFDFSLCKFEAPLEYQAIREHLSPVRVEAAEQGPEHVVARKLHGLFLGEIPDTPRLVETYGRRATEIIKSRDANPHGTKDDGIFRGWIGIDATSLWAAATSGHSAIAVHLLACMLARMFSSAEATAIWEELVAARKLAISSPNETDPLYFAKRAAANMDISRQQLANWDASARAWLTVADKVNSRRQTQVRLIVQNVVLPVNQRNTVLRSVIEAWRSALTNVEKILSGISCTVTDGAVLLALSSWHIYPDLHMMGHGAGKIEQADNLIPDGVLVTLGTLNASPDSANGVYWSLPLAHLRYYGDPVLVSGSLTDHVNRLSRSEVLMTTLGSIFATWKQSSSDIDEMVELVHGLSSYLFHDHHASSDDGLHWLQHLSLAATEFLSAQGLEREHFRSLINRGRYCYGGFLCQESLHPGPMFGLQDIARVLELAATEEDKVAILRIFAEDLNAPPDSLLIRYKPRRFMYRPSMELSTGEKQLNCSQGFENSYEPSINLDDAWEQLISNEPIPQESQWEYATAISTNVACRKRKWRELSTFAGHTRWTERETSKSREMSLPQLSGETFAKISEASVDDRPSTGFKWVLKSPPNPATRQSKTKSTSFLPWAGDVETAAIFKRADFPLATSPVLTPSKLLRLFDEKLIQPGNLISHLDSLGRLDKSVFPPYTQSLRALGAAMDAYFLMPGATISNTIFSKPLHTAQWANLLSGKPTGNSDQYSAGHDKAEGRKTVITKHGGELQIQPTIRRLDRQQLFACIAMFENRSVDLDPATLEVVLGVAVNNSIYVATPLTCDPCDRPNANQVEHVIGNIGKSGITLMIPPPVPKTRPVDEHNWKPLDHKPAPEKCEYGDSFAKTSLHLSFTRYEVAADTRNHGFQNVEARFLETIVSIYDGDEWVADLDVLKALCSERLFRITARLSEGPNTRRCQHVSHRSNHFVPKTLKLTLIDDWEELLIPPWTSRLLRAEGNKFARLGAAALAVQRGHQVVVLKDKDSICWKCLAKETANGRYRTTCETLMLTDEVDLPTFIY